MKLAITVPAVFPDASLETGIETAADLGVDAIEFFDWKGEDLNAVQAAGDEYGIQFACTLATDSGSNINDHSRAAMTDPDSADTVIEDIESSISVAAALNSHLIVTVGPEQEHLDRASQRESIINILSHIAPVAEEEGVTIVLEPLNTQVDHPGYFLTTTHESINIIETVNSPNVKLLYDVYHQQITEGNIIETVIENLDIIGHIHIADVPGRHEPNTGELNYSNILSALEDEGYEGFIGCEFFPSGDSDIAIKNTIKLIS